jgi:hypothetical protein
METKDEKLSTESRQNSFPLKIDPLINSQTRNCGYSMNFL